MITFFILIVLLNIKMWGKPQKMHAVIKLKL